MLTELEKSASFSYEEFPGPFDNLWQLPSFL